MSVVTDIYLSHFPFESITSLPTAHANEYYLLRILEKKRKHARRERKVNAVIVAQQFWHHRHSSWPSVVPQQTILSCLARYYDGSMWKMPFTCAFFVTTSSMFASS